MEGGTRSISAMYHSFIPFGATLVSNRLSMVAVDQAPIPPPMAESRSPAEPDGSLRGNRQGVLQKTKERIRWGLLMAGEQIRVGIIGANAHSG